MLLISILIVFITTWIPHSTANISINANQSTIGIELDSECSHNGLTRCGSDCKTIVTCIDNRVVNAFKCSDLSTKYPYCIPNTTGCSSQLDQQYDTCTPFVPPEFVCTGDGYFPNPYDCSTYFICIGNAAYKYECPPNYIFDVNKTACIFKEPNADCTTIQCTMANSYAVYQPNRAFYAFCSVVDCVNQIIMFRCANPNNHVFNPNMLKCEFECPYEGRFPGETNCQEFYECYWEGTEKLAKRVLSCPENYIFDSISQICVPGTC